MSALCIKRHENGGWMLCWTHYAGGPGVRASGIYRSIAALDEGLQRRLDDPQWMKMYWKRCDTHALAKLTKLVGEAKAREFYLQT